MTIHDPKPTATRLPAVTFDWEPKSVDPWEADVIVGVDANTIPWEVNEPDPPGTAPAQEEILYSNAQSELTFTAEVRLDPGDYILSYEWDFGDGHKGHGQEVKHTYIQTHPSMRVSVCVVDNHGRKVCTGRQIILKPAEPLSVGEGLILEES